MSTSSNAFSDDGVSAVEVVVVDIGSGRIRGGWAGEDTPRCELPNVWHAKVRLFRIHHLHHQCCCHVRHHLLSGVLCVVFVVNCHLNRRLDLWSLTVNVLNSMMLRDMVGIPAQRKSEWGLFS